MAMDDLIASAHATLPGLIEQAAAALAAATTAAEVLDAKNKAGFAYTTAKAAARFAEAKNAHDAVVAACHKAMGDALLIEKTAQCRLADEYDAAQERGDVQKPGGDRKSINVPNENNDVPTVEDVGLTRKQVHEARAVRDAEKEHPGIVRKTIEDKLSAGKEPTRADVRRAISPAPSDNEVAEYNRLVEEGRKVVADMKADAQPSAKKIMRFEVPANEKGWDEIVPLKVAKTIEAERNALAAQLNTWIEALKDAGLYMVEPENLKAIDQARGGRGSRHLCHGH